MIYILITPNKHGTHNNQEPNKIHFYKPNLNYFYDDI